MSSALYNTRLYWDGIRGIAKHDGVAVDLRAWPAAALPVRPLSIDYTPEVRRAEIHLAGETHPQAMTGEQKTAVFAWLRRIAEAARTSVEG